MDYGLIAVITLWSIILFSVIIHFFSGYKKGAKKSLYFFATNFLAIISSLAIFSLITVSWFFTPETFYTFLTNIGADVSSYENIISNEMVASAIFSVIDILIKLLLFFILLPLMKFILNLVFFKPIYNLATAGQERNINYSSRNKLTAGLFGSFKGFVSTIVYLIPIIVLVGVLEPAIEAIVDASDDQSTTHTNSLSISNYLDSGSNNEIEDMLSDFSEYFVAIKKFNDFGPYAAVKHIPFNNKPVVDQLFDMVFYLPVKLPDDNYTSVTLSNEFRGLSNSFAVLYSKGYLNSNFDYNTISSSDLINIKEIFNYLESSTLMSAVIPIGLDIMAENYSEDIFKLDITTREHSMNAIRELQAINWLGSEGEFSKLYSIVESVLEIGSVGELIELLDVNDIADINLTENEVSGIYNLLTNINTLDLLKGGNLLVDYLTTLDVVQKNFTYIDSNSIESHLQNLLEPILSNPNYFKEGIFDTLAELVVLATSNPNVDLIDLISNITNPDYILTEEYAIHLANIINKTTEITLLIDLIPLAVDFGLFGMLEMDRNNLEIDGLVDIATGINFGQSIKGITDIYVEIAKLGLSPFIKDDVNAGLIADHLAKNHMSSIRLIASSVLTLDPVEQILKKASPFLVSEFFNAQTDEQLLIKDFIINDLLKTNADGLVEFDVGAEVSNILTIIEGLYQVTDFEELNYYIETVMNFINPNAGEPEDLNLIYADLVDIFVKLDNFNNLPNSRLTYDEFSGAFKNLELLNIGHDFIFELLNQNLGNDLIYLTNKNTDAFNIGDEISSLLDLFKAFGSYHTNESSLNYHKVDLSQFVNNELKSYILSSSLLVKSNIAFQISEIVNSSSDLSSLISLDSLTSEFDSQIWEDEIDVLFNIIFDLNYGLFVSSNPNSNFKLSFNDLTNNVTNYRNIKLEEFYKFSDTNLANETFSSIGQSQIISSSLINFVENFEVEGITFNFPNELRNDDLINGSALADLISDLVNFAVSYNDVSLNLGTINDVLSININELSYRELLNSFYEVNVEDVTRLSSNLVLNDIFNDLLTNENIHNIFYDTLSNISSNLVVNEGLFENLVLEGNELGELILLTYNLELPIDIINSNFTINNNNLINYLTNVLTEEELNEILTYPVVHQLLTNVLNHENIKAFVATTINNLMDSASPAVLNDLEIDIVSYLDLINSFKANYYYENSNMIVELFDVSEITSLFTSYKLLNLSSVDDLNNLDLGYLNTLKNQYSNNINSNLEVFTNSKLIRALIAHALTDENLQSTFVNLANNLLSDFNIDYVITLDQIVIEAPLVTTEGNHLVFSQEVLVEALETIIAVNLNSLLNNTKTPYDLIINLNDLAFNTSHDMRTGVDVIYDLTFVEEGSRFITENDRISTALTNTINNVLTSLINQISPNLLFNYPITNDDVVITSEMVNKDNLVQIVESFKGFNRTGINNILKHRTLNDFYMTFNLETNKTPLVQLLQTPLFKTPITRVTSHDLWSDLVSQFTNNIINQYASSITLSKDVFSLDYNTDNELIVDLVDLVASVWSTGVDLGVNINPQLLRNLETEVITYNNISDFRLNQIFKSNIIVNYLDKVIQHDEIISQGATLLNNQLHNLLSNYNLDLDYEITSSILKPNSAALLNGKINPNEYKVLIKTFNELNLVSFSELSNLTKIDYLHNKIANTLVVETLFESKWLHHSLSNVLTSASLQRSFADLMSSEAAKRFSVDVTVDYLAFDFTDSKYELFTNDNLVSVAVIKDTLILTSSHNWLNVISLNPNILLSNLLADNRLGSNHITEISKNKIVIALFDRLANPNYNDNSFINVYAAGLNYLLGRFNFGPISEASYASLFNYSNNLLNSNNVLDSNELVKLVNGLSLMDLSNPSAFSIKRLSSLINRDLNNNMTDDFEEFFASNLMNHFIVRIARSEGVYESATSILTRVLGNNINIPVADIMFPEQLINNNIISMDELKRLIIAGDIIESSSSGFADLSPNVLLDVVGQNISTDGIDDLDRILASEYFVYVIGNIFNNNGLNSVANRLITRITGSESELDITVPSYLINDNNNQDLSHGRLSRDSIRHLFVSAKLLFGDEPLDTNAIDISLIIDAIGRDDNNNGIDDFDEVNDLYIHYLLASLLTDNSVKQLIVDGAKLNLTELVFSQVMYDSNNMMSKDEVKHLFSGLKDLGVSSFDNMATSINEDMLETLDETQITNLLQSSYLYLLIDLTIKDQIHIPNEALNITGDFNGYVNKDEIIKLVNALEVVGGSLDLDVNSFTVGDIKSLYNLNSVIIDSFISNEMNNMYPEALNPDAYRNNTTNLLSRDEISNLIETLEVIIGPAGLLNSLDTIDLDGVTTTDLEYVVGLNSYLVTRILTKEITTSVFTLDEVPLDSFVDPNTKLDLTQSELEKMVASIKILDLPLSELNEMSSKDITSSKLDEILKLESPLLEYQISETIKSSLGTEGLPATALDSEGNVLRSELDKLVFAIFYLGDDLDMINTLTPYEIDSTLLNNLLSTNSYIVDYQISNIIIDALGEEKIPNSAKDLSTGNISRAELETLGDVIDILGGSVQDVVNLEADQIYITQLVSLLDSNSKIVETQISDAVISSMAADEEVPLSALNLDGSIKKDELYRLFDAVDILVSSVGELATLSADHITGHILESALSRNSIVFEYKVSEIVKNTFSDPLDLPTNAIDSTTGDITRLELDRLVLALIVFDQPASKLADQTTIEIMTGAILSSMLEKESLIVERHMALGIESTMTDIPLSAYEDGYISSAELDKLVNALSILNGDIKSLSTIEATTITAYNLTLLTDLKSTIIDYQMSEAIIITLFDNDKTNVPSSALNSENNISNEELSKLSSALTILGGTLDGISELDAENIDSSTLTSLTNLESFIIDYQMSEAITTSLGAANIPNEALNSEGNISRDELIKITEALTLLGGTLDGISNLDADTMEPSLLEDLLALESFIIDRQLSNTLISILDTKVPTYVKDSEGNIIRDELIRLSVAVNSLLVPTIGSINTLDQYSINGIQVLNIINSNSAIALRIVSDAIITTNLHNPESIEATGNRAGEVKLGEMVSIGTALSLSGGNIANITNVNFTTLLTATDDEIDEIFNGDSTIIYYLISDEIKANPFLEPTFDDSDFVNSDRNNHLTRLAITARLKA